MIEKSFAVGVAEREHGRYSGPAEDFVGVDAGGRERAVGVVGVAGGEPDADGAAGDVRGCRFEGDDNAGVTGCESGEAAAVRRRVSRSVVKPSVQA